MPTHSHWGQSLHDLFVIFRLVLLQLLRRSSPRSAFDQLCLLSKDTNSAYCTARIKCHIGAMPPRRIRSNSIYDSALHCVVTTLFELSAESDAESRQFSRMWFIYLPVALLCMHVAYQRYFHPLAKIPGPFLASVTPLWLVWQCFHGRRPRLDIQLHQRYGSVVRISPNEIILSNPDYLRTVYGAGTRFRKSRFYEAPTDKHAQEFDWDRLDMLAEKDIEKLRVQKRFAGPVYSEKNAMKHEALVDNGLRGMLKRFRSLTGRPLDIYYEWEILNVDVLSEFTFGTPFGAIEAGSDGGHMHTMDRMWAWW